LGAARDHKDSPELFAKAVRRLSIRRSAEPDEMAGPTVFLCSRLASYMIGQTLIVDGGMSLIS
jgi:3-oxoacyl-[acyl-carrier protein] reductase